jgi:hypothetical protein
MTDAIAGEVMVYQAITIFDITDHGMRIAAPFALHNDSLHEFRLRLGTRAVIVKGRVDRCEIGELRDGVVLYSCDVAFVDPAAHVRDTIRDFVAVHQAPPPRLIDGEVADG